MWPCCCSPIGAPSLTPTETMLQRELAVITRTVCRFAYSRNSMVHHVVLWPVIRFGVAPDRRHDTLHHVHGFQAQPTVDAGRKSPTAVRKGLFTCGFQVGFRIWWLELRCFMTGIYVGVGCFQMGGPCCGKCWLGFTMRLPVGVLFIFVVWWHCSNSNFEDIT